MARVKYSDEDKNRIVQSYFDYVKAHNGKTYGAVSAIVKQNDHLKRDTLVRWINEVEQAEKTEAAPKTESIKKVKKRASPNITWFGGICCKERALFIKSKTIAILKKAVISITIEGASDKIDNRNRICKDKAISRGLLASFTWRFILGIGILTLSWDQIWKELKKIKDTKN